MMLHFGKTVLLLAALGALPEFLHCAPPPQQVFNVRPQSGLAEVSQRVDVRLYLDATSSMKGFAKPNYGYVASVQQLEQTITLGWSDSRVDCWKFGAQPQPLKASSCYLLVDGPDFFLKKPQDITRIDRILDQSDGAHLELIATDLYQDETDLAAVFRSAQRQVFDRGLVIGIAAMRSPFAGTIYDIGLFKNSHEWKGDRPWYLITVGKEPDIDQLFTQMSKPPMKMTSDRFLVLSAKIMQRPVSWDSVATQPSRVAEDPRVISVSGSTVPFKVYHLQDDVQSGLQVKLSLVSAPFHPALDLSQAGAIRVSSDARKLGSGTPQPVSQTVAKIRAGTTTIALSWDIQHLSQTAEYAQELKIDFNPEAVRFPPFVAQWSVPMANADKDLKDFDGSKTQTLAEFVNGLWRLAIQRQGADLGVLYLYFKR